MKRKMLISISLLLIMILNCISPLFMVNATEGEDLQTNNEANEIVNDEIRLNGKLYIAVRNSLRAQGIDFKSNDFTKTLVVKDLSTVTQLNLNESSIADLTGLDFFKDVERLELSGNRLTKNSNLEVLNNFEKLKHLDLSTNQIEDVSEITPLIARLTSMTDGKFIITGQSVTKVYTACVDTSEDSNNDEIEEFEMPQILSLIGFLKPDWRKFSSTPETPGSSVQPYISPINPEDVPMYPQPGSKVRVHIADEYGNGLVGLTSLKIHVYDDDTNAVSAINTNIASENMLYGSKFNLYYVVYADTTEAITTMDTNLYKAIKEQLTGGQDTNPDIESYIHATDEDGNALYIECLYNIVNNKIVLYREKDSNNNPIYEYILDSASGNIYYYTSDGNGMPINGDLYSDTKDYESTIIQKVDSNGQITLYQGLKIPAAGSDSVAKTLYVAAYDDAKTFVIKDSVLTNKITSLVLNNKQIRDLSGIEYFIGLTSNLNVSHNYLEYIDPVYSLETNKDAWQAQLVEQYMKWQNGREYGNLSTALAQVRESESKLYTQDNNVKNAAKQVATLLREVAQIKEPEVGNESSATDYSKKIEDKIKSLNKILDNVYGYTNDNGDYVKGYLDLIQDAINELQGYYNEEDGIQYKSRIDAVYGYLATLYDLYNDEYKLTTLLSESNNYITLEEYEAYCAKTTKPGATRDSAYALLTEEIAYLTNLEAADGISSLENTLLGIGIGVTANQERSTLARYFENLTRNNPMSRVEINALLKEIRRIAIYAEMGNYCLIKRMNSSTADGYCYEEEYLKRRITELGYDEIDSELEQEILKNIEKYKENSANVTDPLLSGYMNYKASLEYTSEDDAKIRIYPCTGRYIPVKTLSYTGEEYDVDALIEKATEGLDNANTSAIYEVLGGTSRTIYEYLHWREVVTDTRGETMYTSDEDCIFLYKQMVTLATKLALGNAERYVTLPRLRALNVSYNAELENLQGITILKDTLTDINAEYCYIADVDNIDWSEMTNLKKLNLGYNYISDIRPLSGIKNLRTLILRNNLLSGELQITATDYYSIYRNLKELDLSGNQITDIKSILIYLDYISNGNFANYVAREDTVNINLNNQKIEIEYEKDIDILEYPTTINIDLPPIFSQLLGIDVNRTAFGETSQDGRIESEGKYVVLNTRSVGDKVGTVVVKAMSGNGRPVDTCVGKGTTANIYYKVINSLEDKPKLVSIRMLDSNRNLTASDLLTLMLQYSGNPTKVTLVFSLADGSDQTKPVEFTISPDVNKKQILDIDLSKVFKDNYDGEYILRDIYFDYNIDKDPIHYSKFAGNTELCEDTNAKMLNADLKFNYQGVLGEKPAPEEPENPEQPENPENPENPQNPENPEQPQGSIQLGYSVSGDKLIDIRARTPIDEFKTNLLNGYSGYRAVVIGEEDGESVVITDGYIGTGMLVRIEDENGNTPLDENGNPLAFEIIVKGDVDGNGEADRRDSSLIKNARGENIELTDEQYDAADIDCNGSISFNDSKLLLYHRGEVLGYSLNY